ncbi:zinc-binding dehydrogenase [Rhodomicrobium lacus]|uniref:zinc-binding dehydrogenase n=1 Tax=Rhodomicrobium lacus TaxID=2498452 RepID=UPI001AECFE91|nr:zinc-binding dehydrogenase [Rhodomicrobium lacus]
MAAGDRRREAKSRVRQIVSPNAWQLSDIAALIDAGKVRPLVEHVFPLSHAAEAHRLSEQGRMRGKSVLGTEVI